MGSVTHYLGSKQVVGSLGVTAWVRQLHGSCGNRRKLLKPMQGQLPHVL